jgi:hypothetical protein
MSAVFFIFRWISFWSSSAYEGGHAFGMYFAPQSEGRSAQVAFVSVYAVIIALSIVAATLRSLWAGKALIDDSVYKLSTIV